MAARAIVTTRFDNDDAAMRRALELAVQGIGSVEPNPAVGAVIVNADGEPIGEGYHERFGGPHAEVNALESVTQTAAGGTLFVSLEPCCHRGKTGPCTEAIIAAGLRRVVVGTQDPNPNVAGQGIAALRQAGITVDVGVLEQDCQRMIAPFAKLITTGTPWVHAKWAMTLDGKLASRTGHSQWISGEASRRIVHRLRGRMDAIIVGSCTAEKDDPLLTARPPGPRTAARIVVSRSGRLDVNSQLVQTASEAPVMVTSISGRTLQQTDELRTLGVEVLELPAAQDDTGSEQALAALDELLRELGRRNMTNVLVEGGSHLLGCFHDRKLIDEVHVFVAPKLLGGATAVSPIGGFGHQSVSTSSDLTDQTIEIIDGDVYIHGIVSRRNHTPERAG